MAHSYHHAVSSARKWGGVPEDYLPVHTWFDKSKEIVADFRHRALRHHAEGVFMAETVFGVTLTNSAGRVVPVRMIGEQHIVEDLGRIPSFADWVRAIRPEPWMGRKGANAISEDAVPPPADLAEVGDRDAALFKALTLRAIRDDGRGLAHRIMGKNGWTWTAGELELNAQTVRDLVNDGWLDELEDPACVMLGCWPDFADRALAAAG